MSALISASGIARDPTSQADERQTLAGCFMKSTVA